MKPDAKRIPTPTPGNVTIDVQRLGPPTDVLLGADTRLRIGVSAISGLLVLTFHTACSDTDGHFANDAGDTCRGDGRHMHFDEVTADVPTAGGEVVHVQFLRMINRGVVLAVVPMAACDDVAKALAEIERRWRGVLRANPGRRIAWVDRRES
jgi:hypothetical protein